MTQPHFSVALFKWFVCMLCLCCGLAWGQDEEEQPLRLPEAEVQRLRAVLAEPIDPNALKLKVDEAYRQKDYAAWKLGDMVQREANLREWVQVQPSARWTLRNFLANTEKRPEAYALGEVLLKESRPPHDAVRLRCNIAMNYIDDRNLKQAATLLNEAEKLIQFEFKNVNRRGSVAYWLIRAEMEFLYTKSIYLMRIGKWPDGMAAAKLAVAKAKESFGSESLTDARNITYGRHWYISALGSLATQQTTAGLYSEAASSLREAIQFAKNNGFSDHQMVGIYNRYADLRNTMGQFTEAQAYAEKSEAIVLSQGYAKGSPQWIYSQNRKITALVGTDKWPAAMNLIQLIDQEKGRLNNKSLSGNNAQVRGWVYLKSAKYAEAKRVLGNSLSGHIDNFGEDHYFTASIRGLYAAALWRTGDLIGARKHFDQAMRNISAPEVLTGDIAEGALRKKSNKFIFQSYFEMLADTASTNPQDAALIFQLADHLNASSVQQALSDAAVRSGVSIPGLADIIRQEQESKNEMASLIQYMTSQGTEEDKKRNPQVLEQMRARLREIELQRKGYKAQIQKSFPEYFQLIQPKPPTHKDVAQSLQVDELFVSILPVEDKTYVWAIDAAGQVQFHQWNQGEKFTQAMVERIRQTLDVAGLGNRAPAFDFIDAHQLYKGLLGPIESQMQGKSHLIIATSGALAKIPMGVLVRTPVANGKPRDAAWLIKDMAISHVPTASGWLSLKRYGKIPSSVQPLMAWGDPLFDNVAAKQVASANAGNLVRSIINTRAVQPGGLEGMDADNFLAYSKIPALPETRDEVLELAKILQADPTQDVILGANATRASVLKSSASGQLGKKQVVVFATHGLLAGDLPNLNQPALAMASSSNPNESPLLTLEDVLSLKLNADWVVLSACNTAGADGRAEEALSGLARGFFFAGSRSLLVTHWSVESESAMLLTTHTFAAYKKNPSMRRAEALRLAMLQTMSHAEYGHPAYWAPYALVGEGGR